MGTRGPFLVESGGGFPFEAFLLIVIVGIVFISAWLTWLFLKGKSKGNTDVVEIPPASTTGQSTEAYLLSLRRTLAGEWEIQVNGQRYRNLEAVPDDATRKEVVAGLKELVNFAKSYIQKGQTTQAQVPDKAQVEPSPPTVAPPVAPPPVAAPAGAVPPPTASQPAPSPASIPRLSLQSEPQLKRSSMPATLMPTIDLAREIGDIVAEMQVRSPTLRDRSIRLRNAPSGGVEFAIDGIAYAAVEEIPDPEIQDLIHAATREWERR